MGRNSRKDEKIFKRCQLMYHIKWIIVKCEKTKKLLYLLESTVSVPNNFKICIDGKEIDKVNNSKYLGIIIDEIKLHCIMHYLTA